eukprot:469767_1
MHATVKNHGPWSCPEATESFKSFERNMATDLIEQLPDGWWLTARHAKRWKPRYECIKEIFEILTNSEEIVALECEILDHKKANDFMQILTDWLVKEDHIFTRIGILHLMPLCIKAFSVRVIAQHQTQLFETLMTKQWAEKKQRCLRLVTPTCIALWLKSCVALSSAVIKPHLIDGLQYHALNRNLSVCDFITKAIMYPSTVTKRQVFVLFEDKDIATLLGKLALTTKHHDVRIQACKAMYCLNECGVMKAQRTSKHLRKQYEQLLQYDRRSIKAVRAWYNNHQPKEEKELCSTFWNEQPNEEKESKQNVFAEDEKEENGQLFKKVVRRVTKQRVISGSKKTLTKGHGGRLCPEGFIRRRTKAKLPKAKYLNEYRPMQARCLEDNKKALAAAQKFTPCTVRTAFKKLDFWIQKDADSLKKTAKIRERIATMERIAEEMNCENNSINWNVIYDAIIALASETMGWEGRDARNPILSKTFLSLIGQAMGSCESAKRDSGMFTLYLEWALQRLSEKKFRKLATECLLATCYQYAPKVVISQIEKLLLEPEDDKRNMFETERAWGPVIAFIGDAVTAFGVDNFYVCRTIHLIQQKMILAKDKNAKDACCSALKALYQQLGSRWKDILSCEFAGKPVRKRLHKEFGAVKNHGTYTQLRCTKKERVPEEKGEIETYEEEVVEWLKIKDRIPKTEEQKEDTFTCADPPREWCTLYDANGVERTDEVIELIRLRNVEGIKRLETWLRTGHNVSIVESAVHKLLRVLLPWLTDLMDDGATGFNDQRYYVEMYAMLQLLILCGKFRTLNGLNRSELTVFFRVLLSGFRLFGDEDRRILGAINDVLVRSIRNTAAADTLCVLIQLLAECDPMDESGASQQYEDACGKLTLKVIKRYDAVICEHSDQVQSVYVQIIRFFRILSLETWQKANAQRRFPLKVIQMVIARLVWFCGSHSGSYLNAAIHIIQKTAAKDKSKEIVNDGATRVIMEFIAVCESRRSITDDDEKDVKVQSSSAQQNDLNFALWVVMTGRNKHDYGHVQFASS